jgi:DNA-binding transcriptional ArsR family regulator
MNNIKQHKIESLAKKIQTAGDPNRLKILCYIFKTKKACVSDIALELGMSVAITSHHLQALTRASLLKSEREGKKICYTLSKDNMVADFRDFICKYK